VLHRPHAAHGFVLRSQSVRVEQPEDRVFSGVPEVVCGEHGDAAASGRHARRIADVFDGSLDRLADAALAPAVPVGADGLYADVEVFEADDAL
jgi:hypothetical protein